MRAPKYRLQPCRLCGTEGQVLDGAWLRSERQRAGYTLRGLALLGGYSATYLCDIEHNRRACTLAVRRLYEGMS